MPPRGSDPIPPTPLYDPSRLFAGTFDWVLHARQHLKPLMQRVAYETGIRHLIDRACARLVARDSCLRRYRPREAIGLQTEVGCLHDDPQVLAIVDHGR